MNNRRKLVLVAALAVMQLWLADGPRPALAQLTPPPDHPLSYITRDPIVIGSQMKLALATERRALRILTGPESAQSIATASRLVEDGYAMLRFAVAGVNEAQGTKYADPMHPMQLPIMEHARAILRTTLTELGRVQAGYPERLPFAVQTLSAAIAKIETAVQLVP